MAVRPYRRMAVRPYRRMAVRPYRRMAVRPYRRMAVRPYRRMAELFNSYFSGTVDPLLCKHSGLYFAQGQF